MGSSTKTIRYVYDSRGNRKALVDHDGGRTTYVYDNVNRLKSVENAQNQRTTYSYDGANRRTLKEMANGTRASFAYDPAGNLTKLYNLKNDGTVLSSFDYAYDKVGNRTAVREADGSRVTWSYDNTYQLTGEHRTGSNGYRDTYTYDPSGNRTLKVHDGARTTYAYDAANQLTYSHDVSGRTTYTFDADGNQQVVRAPSGDRTTYVWDYENRMTSVQHPSGIRNTMAYDADGLRIKLEESGGTKKFVWDEQNCLAETDATNDTQVVYTNEPRVYGNLVSQRRGSTSHWYHFDAIGSTRELTNASAVITDTRLYDAWGRIAHSTGTTALSALFTGESGSLYLGEAELFASRMRLLTSIGRWLSRDPLFPAVGPNAYVYVHNQPTQLLDPSGLAELIANPTKPDSMPWCAEKLLRGIGGDTVPIAYNAYCWYECCDLERQHYFLKCRIVVYLKLLLDRTQLSRLRPRWTAAEGYGHEQQHVKSLLNQGETARAMAADRERAHGCAKKGTAALDAQVALQEFLELQKTQHASHTHPDGPAHLEKHFPIGTMPTNSDCNPPGDPPRGEEGVECPESRPLQRWCDPFPIWRL
jgi:RHS repeat-associated protein